MLSISFGKWMSKLTSMFVWERVYRNIIERIMRDMREMLEKLRENKRSVG